MYSTIMNRNLQYTLKYDPCNHMFSFGIETVQRQMSLYDYQPGKLYIDLH